MALVLADRVKETTTTTGTSDFVLSGADTGFQTFSAGVGANNTTYYAVSLGSDFEIGLGTLSANGLTLARTTVLQSSNADAKVSFAAGSKFVFVTYPADKAVLTDATQTLTNKTLNSPTLVTPALGTPSALVGTNITGTASGLTAGNVTTNANLTGDVTSVGNATTLTNAPVIAKVLTGYVSGAGTVAATDSILQAIQKLNGNDATNANLTGMVTSNGNATTVVTNANLTGAITSNGNATSLGSFSSANLLGALTDETGTGSAVFATSPTLITPVLGTPSSGTLSACTVDGTDAVGFRNIPQNSQSTAYTLVLADSGKHILHPSSDANARTFTIPANSSVAYPIGTAITFINMTSQVLTIAITTDTMYLSSAGTTGSRSLAQYGSATAIKITSTNWLISGSGLT